MIEIVPYQARWPAEFRALGAQIRSAFGEAALRIDHIGSTAVPGLAAKDILDLMVTVADFGVLEPALPALEGLGFVRRAYSRDHAPAWDRSPVEQWEKRYLNRRDPHRWVNLHIRVVDRANQRYALLFRDYLRATPEAATAYAALKRELVRYHGDDPDIAAYAEIKDPACDLIMVAAEAWAAVSGWQPRSADV